MSRYFGEAFSVIFISFIVNFCAELVVKIFIQNTDEYQNNYRKLKKVSQELDKKKSQIVSANDEKKQKKAIQKLKDEEKDLKQELSYKTTRTNMVISMITMLLMGVFRSYFSGVVVAKLPFQPFSLFRGLFHAGLKGTNYYDCSMTGLYILCNMTFRQNIKMLMGTQGPRSASGGFQAMMEEAEEKTQKYYAQN